MDCEEIKVPEEFSDICPYNDEDFHREMSVLVTEPGFEHAVKYAMPNVDYPAFCQQLLQIRNKHDFQIQIMLPFLKKLVAETTKGVTASGMDNIVDGVPNVCISNHRDIVLDPGFISVGLLQNGFPTTVEIAIGDNLLIYPWIKKLVRVNKSFIVQRALSMRQMLESSARMSRYIHFAITQKHENVWIAQREGRAKDSNDHTQESVLKMLAIGGEGNVIDRLQELNIVPMSLSYEYDPCDFLKAEEMQSKRDIEGFKKSQEDDLNNMRTGIFGYKGRVHFQAAPCINETLETMRDLPKTEVFRKVAELIDREIHRNYRLYPGNYVACDLLEGKNRFAGKYTPEEKAKFEAYLQNKLDMIKLDNKDEAFLRERMLTMYANPLLNHLKALEA